MEVLRYCARIGHTPLCFEEGLNGVTPIRWDETLPKNTNWSPDLRRLVEGYVKDAQKILQRYPQGVKDVVELDFSGLGLTHLPPQILLECSSAKTLDISRNNIHWLPIQLQNLRLEKLIISGNERLQPNLGEFPWLLKMPGLNIVADDMGFTFIPREWKGRFSSNQVPFGSDWMDCPTQLPIGEGHY